MDNNNSDNNDTLVAGNIVYIHKYVGEKIEDANGRLPKAEEFFCFFSTKSHVY